MLSGRQRVEVRNALRPANSSLQVDARGSDNERSGSVSEGRTDSVSSEAAAGWVRRGRSS